MLGYYSASFYTVSFNVLYSKHYTISYKIRLPVSSLNRLCVFYPRYQELLDQNQAPFYLFSCAMRWLAVRLDVISVALISITALMIVLMHGQIPPAYAGLAISYAVQVREIVQNVFHLLTLSVSTI